jgi:hypothetical protein
MYWLQNQNIKREVVKKINIDVKPITTTTTTTTTTPITVEKEPINESENT